MTPTATLVEQTSTPTTEVQAFKRPTKREVVKAVRDEALYRGVPCTLKLAAEFYDMIVNAVEHIRFEEYGETYWVMAYQIERLHGLLEVIMPDEVTNPPDSSAHALIHQRFLRRSEFAIVHTRSCSEHLSYCALAIRMPSV